MKKVVRRWVIIGGVLALAFLAFSLFIPWKHYRYMKERIDCENLMGPETARGWLVGGDAYGYRMRLEDGQTIECKKGKDGEFLCKIYEEKDGVGYIVYKDGTMRVAVKARTDKETRMLCTEDIGIYENGLCFSKRYIFKCS